MPVPAEAATKALFQRSLFEPLPADRADGIDQDGYCSLLEVHTARPALTLAANRLY